MGKVPTDVEPILISEDWLEKFGFEKVHKIYYLQVEDEGACFRADKDRSGDNYYIACLRRGNYFANTAINYVHQVQNLFFALTGKDHN